MAQDSEAKGSSLGRRILTINAGSSSIRIAVFEAASELRVCSGKVERIDSPGASLAFDEAAGRPSTERKLKLAAGAPVSTELLEILENEGCLSGVEAIGHRVVQGMSHSKPARLTNGVLEELGRFAAFDPDHLPREIELMRLTLDRYPKMPQVACFDTAFHQDMPRVAKLLPLPRRYEAKGLQRYGFHGLSYSFLLEELRRVGDPAASSGRVILAHLGSGASLAAVRNGKSIDTSMGFTPNSGLPMSTRSGDLDPGLMRYFSNSEGMSAESFQEMVNKESGLLGISETSSDVRDLLSREGADVRAKEALDLFCYQARKWIGAYAAALGGLDTLVFAGGIGEKSPEVRARICEGLGFLGIELDGLLNQENAPVISEDGTRVVVRAMRTNEELMIARSVTDLLKRQATGKN